MTIRAALTWAFGCIPGSPSYRPRRHQVANALVSCDEPWGDLLKVSIIIDGIPSKSTRLLLPDLAEVTSRLGAAGPGDVVAHGAVLRTWRCQSSVVRPNVSDDTARTPHVDCYHPAPRVWCRAATMRCRRCHRFPLPDLDIPGTAADIGSHHAPGCACVHHDSGRARPMLTQLTTLSIAPAGRTTNIRPGHRAQADHGNNQRAVSATARRRYGKELDRPSPGKV
jgi:hypothetical protein